MWEKIVAFFTAIIAFFASLFGFGGTDTKKFSYDNLAYGTQARQVLDLRIPNNENKTLGLVLMIHGGAWIEGDKSDYKYAIDNGCDEWGYACAAMNYRYISETSHIADILDDIDAALKTIKGKAAENGVTINKVLLTGSSAGAHLSLLYAYSRKDTAPITPAAVVSFCGPTDLTEPTFFTNNNIGDEETMSLLMSWACGKSFTYDQLDSAKTDLAAISPITYVNESTVPTVLAHGEKDITVPYQNALDLDAKLTEFGVKHDFVSYPNSDHGLANDEDCNEKTYNLFYQYCNDYLK